MCLQSYLVEKFSRWRPAAPCVVARNKGDITLSWMEGEPFGFLRDQLLYRVERWNKMPRWVVVYSGGKTSKVIDNLAPRTPHKFRLRVILKATAVPHLADAAIAYFGDEHTAYETMNQITSVHKTGSVHDGGDSNVKGFETEDDVKDTKVECKELPKLELNGGDQIVMDDETLHCNNEGAGDGSDTLKDSLERARITPRASAKWLESQWSEETWTSTDTDGSSPVCFCMAVRCGYLRQIQGMLDERPDLIGITNPSNGFTPLAVAVRKGDINTVKFLVSAGAEIDQPSATGQVPLHLAILSANMAITELLMDKGADMTVGDCNGVRSEHYAVDSCDVEMVRYVMDRGGDVHAKDNNGWTPLFRAVCQGAKTEMIEELVSRGSDVDLHDAAGLPLSSVARLLTDRHGRGRSSVLRLVDSSYPHEKALENFTRLTKKIYNVSSLLKLA